jgi:hypothetical protein
VFLCAFSACTVGSPLATQVGGDDNMIDAPMLDAPGNGCVTRSTPGLHHTHLVGGTSNAGQACVVSACHMAGAMGVNAPAWAFAGTVYQGDMTTVNAGVLVIVTDADGKAHKSVTDDGGNFYISDDGTIPNPFPGHSTVTACPTLTSMTGILSATAAPATGNNCNGCHVPGGVAPQSTPIVLTP